MPARRAVDDPAAELERIRALAAERKRQQRSRDAEAALRDGHVTRSQRTARPVTPSQTLPVLSALSTREIEKTLSDFTGRGYVHSERFWQLASEQYPLLCLELEAIKAADWLLTPKNEKRRCTKAFLDNWLKKAEQDRKERLRAEALASPAAQRAGLSPKGVVTNGTYHPPASMQKNPGPDTPPLLVGDLVRNAPGDWERFRAERAGSTLDQKLAAKTNGAHK